MPLYKFTFEQDYVKRKEYREYATVLVQAPDEGSARTFVDNELDVTGLDYDDEEFLHDLDDDNDDTVPSLSLVERVTSGDPDYTVPEIVEEEEEDSCPKAAHGKIIGIDAFWRVPQPGWWRSRYQDSHLFDLDCPEDVEFLKDNGVAAVQLSDRSVIQLQSAEEWAARKGVK